MGRDSSVGNATCYRLDGRGMESRWGASVGASTFWNPQGLPRPVMGLLYLYILDIINVIDDSSSSVGIVRSYWSDDRENLL